MNIRVWSLWGLAIIFAAFNIVIASYIWAAMTAETCVGGLSCLQYVSQANLVAAALVCLGASFAGMYSIKFDRTLMATHYLVAVCSCFFTVFLLLARYVA